MSVLLQGPTRRAGRVLVRVHTQLQLVALAVGPLSVCSLAILLGRIALAS
jgi:hypothetical protein